MAITEDVFTWSSTTFCLTQSLLMHLSATASCAVQYKSSRRPMTLALLGISLAHIFDVIGTNIFGGVPTPVSMPALLALDWILVFVAYIGMAWMRYFTILAIGRKGPELPTKILFGLTVALSLYWTILTIAGIVQWPVPSAASFLAPTVNAMYIFNLIVNTYSAVLLLRAFQILHARTVPASTATLEPVAPAGGGTATNAKSAQRVKFLVRKSQAVIVLQAAVQIIAIAVQLVTPVIDPMWSFLSISEGLTTRIFATVIEDHGTLRRFDPAAVAEQHRGSPRLTSQAGLSSLLLSSNTGTDGGTSSHGHKSVPTTSVDGKGSAPRKSENAAPSGNGTVMATAAAVTQDRVGKTEDVCED
ncbi:hypothetical protein AMAG_18366 [Allomyces macrogynus ATCC 38327]|uniref:G-protein coupled receptors family 1 profile domain-containing protein n=1 Tax=Allomyces macrogynus (strain ATCC 38327) TaxID=578462 RepID=A0A0L0S6U8_ALLM3|nr:hypothetical protein AMAG_18366 [Allomyces macrogynus ATCC 38327]|eukprot:KNE58049.1 hypothetical protein AMAG_18366 [Allomyces macrogynus ATCC 38327]